MSYVSVVIPHHTGRLIYDCLHSLRDERVEKIVCSSTPTIFPNVRSVYTPLNEPTHKRNKGVKLSMGDYICFLDDDVTLCILCIKNMQRYLDWHNDVGMVFATLFRTDETLDSIGVYLNWTGFLIENTKRPAYPTPILSGKGACCMIRKKLFDDIGGFDEDFVIYGEETDLSWRVWLAGYKVMQLPFATAIHCAESKDKSYYNPEYIYYHGCKNYITMLIKNLGLWYMPIALINFCLWAFTGVLFLFKSPKKAFWIFQGLWYNIVNLPHILKKRNKIQKERVLTDTELFPYVYTSTGIKYYMTRLWEYLFSPLKL